MDVTYTDREAIDGTDAHKDMLRKFIGSVIETKYYLLFSLIFPCTRIN